MGPLLAAAAAPAASSSVTAATPGTISLSRIVLYLGLALSGALAGDWTAFEGEGEVKVEVGRFSVAGDSPLAPSGASLSLSSKDEHG